MVNRRSDTDFGNTQSAPICFFKLFRPGLMSMANSGPTTNGFHFYYVESEKRLENYSVAQGTFDRCIFLILLGPGCCRWPTLGQTRTGVSASMCIYKYTYIHIYICIYAYIEIHLHIPFYISGSPEA